MAVQILKINAYEYAVGGQNIVADLVVDTVTDLPAINDLSGYILQLGSTAIVVQDSTYYRMMSGGAWVQQLHDNNADVYTKSEVNTLLNAKQDVLTFDATPTQSSTNPVTSGGVYTAIAQMNFLRVGVMIPEYDDMNNYFTPGIYYVGSAGNASNIDNTPVNYAARVEVVPLWGTGRALQRYIIADSGIPIYYVRRYQNGVWSGWYKFEGVAI